MEFQDIYRKYYMRIYAYLLRRNCRKAREAEELAQEVFFQAYLKWEDMKGRSDIEGCLFKMARRKLKEHFNKTGWGIGNDIPHLDD